jgi:hypothetical protein
MTDFMNPWNPTWVTPTPLHHPHAAEPRVDGGDGRGSSTEATTLRHYVKRTHVAPDVRVVLDLLVSEPDSDFPETNVMGK